MELLKTFAIYVVCAAFLSGLFITTVTGSARPVKIYLGLLTALFILASIIGFMVSGGWLIFLYTQLMVLVLIIYFVIIAGAAAGGGIYLLLHNKRRDRKLEEKDLDDYLPVSEFSAMAGITEERARSRIRNGFYKGGVCKGRWYIHKAELPA